MRLMFTLLVGEGRGVRRLLTWLGTVARGTPAAGSPRCDRVGARAP